MPDDANCDWIRDIYLFYTQRAVPTDVPEDQAVGKRITGVPWHGSPLAAAGQLE